MVDHSGSAGASSGCVWCAVVGLRGWGDGGGWLGGEAGRGRRFLGEEAGEALDVKQVRISDVVSCGVATVGAAAKCGGEYQARGHTGDALRGGRVDEDSARGALLGEAADGGFVAGVDRSGVAGACDRKQPLASGNACLFAGGPEQNQQGRELFMGVRIIWADIARRDDQELDRERSLDPSELGDERCGLADNVPSNTVRVGVDEECAEACGFFW